MFYQAIKYKGKWSVFSFASNCYFYIGKGKRFCEKKAQEMNNEMTEKEKKLFREKITRDFLED